MNFFCKIYNVKGNIYTLLRIFLLPLPAKNCCCSTFKNMVTAVLLRYYFYNIFDKIVT